MTTAMPGNYAQQPQHAENLAVIRSIGRCVLLLIVSSGFWSIAWMYHTTKEVSSRVASPPPSAGLRAFLSVIPIVQYFTYYWAWNDIDQYCKRVRTEGIPVVLFLVLAIVFSIANLITFPMIQSKLNDAHRAATGGQATNAKMQGIDWAMIALGIAFWAVIWIVIIAAAASSN
ncbi:hypothetical protein C8N24_5205 [Solirubrobacter pauli]|uniref:DUF4234 domain-containing protein n=1 Tax=Solirubrobacter pauli TaxID=166793 RepID=A0A660L1J2_9ACTN|nr:DUF4234 domain-containing protein [Solirubrobacter pauli]RKQ87185.1 hypothetical protein C8N24_5205 [Solirubrobacter pauli]